MIGIEEQEQRVLIVLAATGAGTTGCGPPIEKNEREKHDCQHPLDWVPTKKSGRRARQKNQSVDHPDGKEQGYQVSDQVERRIGEDEEGTHSTLPDRLTLLCQPLNLLPTRSLKKSCGNVLAWTPQLRGRGGGPLQFWDAV